MGRRKPTNKKNKKKQGKCRQQGHAEVAGQQGERQKMDSSDMARLESQNDYLMNFVREAGPGCHIARRLDQVSAQDDDGHETHGDSFVLEWETVDPADYCDDNADVEDINEIPDLAIDPEESTLTLCNIRPTEFVVAYITVYDMVLRGRNGKPLEQGSTTSEDDNNGTTAAAKRRCTTLIVLCPPCTFCHLVYLDESADLSTLQIDSDVQVWNRHPQPNDEHERAIGFPLQCNNAPESNSSSSNDKTSNESNTHNGAFLCTQGEGGHLTHFFSGNQHAIDFRCPKGTPLVAVGNGVVVEAKQEHTRLTGIAVSNLFSWNAILLRLDANDEDDKNDEKSDDDDGNCADPLFVEYVHIATATVKEGDRVVKGQVIGTSGGIGFSPEDHLHFAGYRSSDPHAPTVRLRFQSHARKDHIFYPRAGNWYDCNGQVVAAPTAAAAQPMAAAVEDEEF